jgi:dipeptidyl aminopeptidase/acylaminoacyl peptidase
MLISKTPITTEEILTKYPSNDNNFSKDLITKIESNIDFFEIEYLVGKFKVKGFISQPKNFNENLPVVIFNRGGCKDFSTINSKALFIHMANFAFEKFVVVGSQYSGNAGSEGKDECGGDDLNSVLELKKVIESLDYVNQNKINMFGVSRGGIMAYLANTKVNWIKKTVIMSGSVDLLYEYKIRPELKEFRSDMYDVNSDKENRKRSIIYNVKKIKPNAQFMIFHGSDDINVHPKRVLDLMVKLYKANVRFSFSYFDGEDHFLEKSRDGIFKKSIDWFKS